MTAGGIEVPRRATVYEDLLVTKRTAVRFVYPSVGDGAVVNACEIKPRTQSSPARGNGSSTPRAK